LDLAPRDAKHPYLLLGPPLRAGPTWQLGFCSVLPTRGINRAAAQLPAGVEECLPLEFRRANLLRHELRRTVSLALKGCAILDRKRVVKDIGGDVA
jgi:hypothetical protein